MRAKIASPLILLGMSLPFLGKPVHIDDTNFLALAQGAAADPWRPHNVWLNWQGSTERAFDVLSNPPGVAWWLAPVVDTSTWIMHLWMLPWLLLAAWGSWTLGERFAKQPAAASLLICGAPVSLLATQGLTPDLPLLACTVAGLGGLTRRGEVSVEKRWAWALLAGSAALFRYSGVAIIPVVAIWGFLQGGRRAAWVLGAVASVPTLTLMVHDLAAYGQAHIFAMLEFQGTSTGSRDLARKLIAAVSMLGGAALLPVLCWSRWRGTLAGLTGGAALGLLGVYLSGHTGPAMWTTLVFATAGGASIGGALGHRWSHRDDRWLAAWAVLGLIFLLALRFTASRYWLPFFPALVLLSLQRAHPRLIQLAVFLTLLLSAGLAVDDHDLAQVQQDMAQKVIGLEEEGGRFAGHWGWQHHLQSSAWIPLEEDSPVPEGKLLAVSSISWPQAPAAGCYELVICVSASPRPFAPRVHAPADGANFHAFMGSALPPSGTAEHPCSSPPTQAWGLEPLESYAPWTFSPSAQEVLTLWRSCRAEPGS